MATIAHLITFRRISIAKLQTPLVVNSPMHRFISLAFCIAVAATAQAQQIPLPPHHEGLAYGDHAEQKIDLWLADSDKPRPLAIFIHGGGFRGGSRKQIGANEVKFFLDQGISFASVDYRLTHNGPYPMQMNDGARAIQWLRANATKYGLNKSRFAAYGGSAGACISLWLAFHDDMADPKSKDSVARESTRLLCAGSQNGQSTLDPRTIREWFGVKSLVEHPALYPLFGVRAYSDFDKPEFSKLVRDAAPITHLTKDDPPVFMANGGADVKIDETTDANTWVHHPRMGIKLKEAMDKLGIECHTMYRGGPATDKYRGLQDFLAQKLLGK